LVLGEAVAAVCLGRGVARWRLRGGANRVDGSNPAGASRQTVEHMVHAALYDSGIAAADVDLIKLQAAGSPTTTRKRLPG
jgi:3-oxoacyl-[acyl-carrier-protein] synthase-1